MDYSVKKDIQWAGVSGKVKKFKSGDKVTEKDFFNETQMNGFLKDLIWQ